MADLDIHVGDGSNEVEGSLDHGRGSLEILDAVSQPSICLELAYQLLLLAWCLAASLFDDSRDSIGEALHMGLDNMFRKTGNRAEEPGELGNFVVDLSKRFRTIYQCLPWAEGFGGNGNKVRWGLAGPFWGRGW